MQVDLKLFVLLGRPLGVQSILNLTLLPYCSVPLGFEMPLAHKAHSSIYHFLLLTENLRRSPLLTFYCDKISTYIYNKICHFNMHNSVALIAFTIL